MEMRRWITYILLIANYVIAIACAVVLAIFLKYKYEDGGIFVNNMRLAVIAPVVAVVVGSILTGLYAFFLNKSLKPFINTTNPKLVTLIKASTYISIVNLILPNLLLMVATTTINNTEPAKNISLGLIIAAFALTGILGLFMTGYVSYINFRISYSEEKRKVLLEGFESNMKMLNDDTHYKDEATKEKYKPKEIVLDDDDSLATSGSFGNETK